MANSFTSVDQVAGSALDFLKRKQTLLATVEMDLISAAIAEETGETVTVSLPASFSANSYNGTTLTVQDITQNNVQLTLNKDFEVTVKWSQREEAASVSAIERIVIEPAMDALMRKVETDIESDFRAGLISAGREFGDAVYGNLVEIEDLADARKALNEQDVSAGDRHLWLSAKDGANLVQKTVFTDASASQRDTLTTGLLGDVFGFHVGESNAIVTDAGPDPDETYNLFYHRTAYMVAMRALAAPVGNIGVEAASATDGGLTVNVTKQWGSDPQSTILVFRVLYGTKLLDANRGGILRG